MKKDVIYIDVEDDITAIIEKLKASKAKIVALVPPKRSTVLSSAVNDKLLNRAAEAESKRIVIITSDSGILAIAGGLGIHVAKNLQSKPYLPDPPETPVQEDNVIEGDLSDLDQNESVGKLAGAGAAGAAVATATKKGKKGKKGQKEESSEAKTKDDKSKKKSKDGKKSYKIPNFERFRFKIIGGAFAVIAIALFWWWAAFIAPSAQVSIVAQTSQLDTAIDYAVDTNVESSDLEVPLLKGEVKEMKKTVTEEFAATGEENVGNKATGTITVTNFCYNPGVISAGTTFTSNSGLSFRSTADVSIDDAIPDSGDCGESEATTADVPSTLR